jgi:hypothetical protein
MLTGRTLGDFAVKEKIGEGGYGVVYRAEQRLLGREAVVKVLHARHQESEALIQRFLREAQLASRLDHPYAAHIYAFGAEPDGLLWIAMEYVTRYGAGPREPALLAQSYGVSVAVDQKRSVAYRYERRRSWPILRDARGRSGESTRSCGAECSDNTDLIKNTD